MLHLVEVRGEVELDAFPGPRERHAANKQDEEDHVRESGGEVHSLKCRIHWSVIKVRPPQTKVE